MRGVVTLAAALTLPEETPLRAELLVIALVVTVGTLVLQGIDPPAAGPRPRRPRARPAGGRPPGGDGARRDDRCRATARRGRPAGRPRRRRRSADPGRGTASTAAGSGSAPSAPPTTRPPARPSARLRTTMIREERAELLRIRDAGQVDHAVLTSILGQLDAEESALGWAATRTAAVRESPLRPPGPHRQRLRAPRRHETPVPPTTAEGARPASPRERAGSTCGSAPTAAGRLLRLLGGQARHGALPRERATP